MTTHPIFTNATLDAFYNQYLVEKSFDRMKGVSHVRGVIDPRDPAVRLLESIKPDILERRPLEPKLLRGVAPLFDYAPFTFENLLRTFNGYAGRFPLVANVPRATALARQNVPIVKTDRLRLKWTSAADEERFYRELGETSAAEREARLASQVLAFRSICADGIPGPLVPFLDLCESIYDTAALPVLFSAAEGRRVSECHYDWDPTLIIQTEGVKEWAFYEPLVPYATESAYIPPIAALKQSPSTKILMRPGDVMILPRGFTHETLAKSARSTHLAVVFKVPSEVEVLAYLMNKRLHRFAQDERLRRIPKEFRSSKVVLDFTKKQKHDAALDLANVQRVYMYPASDSAGRARAPVPADIALDDSIRIGRRPFTVVTYDGCTKILADGNLRVVLGEFPDLGKHLTCGTTLRVRDLFRALGRAKMTEKRAFLEALSALEIATHARS